MTRNSKLIRLVLFSMYGALMFVSKVIMEGLPNIHPLTMFIMTFTVVYGVRALVPTYIYVFLNGLFSGFSYWWLPYLYIWPLQVIITLPIRKLPDKWAAIVYPVVCAFFGVIFGILYAPVQALMFGLSFKQMLAWLASGLTFDILHMAGNFFIGLLILPLSKIIKMLHHAMKIPL